MIALVVVIWLLLVWFTFVAILRSLASAGTLECGDYAIAVISVVYLPIGVITALVLGAYRWQCRIKRWWRRQERQKRGPSRFTQWIERTSDCG